jgi:hypothetical protein
MKFWAATVAISIALFAAGRRAHQASAERAAEHAVTALAAASDRSATAPVPGAAAARHAAMQTLLSRLASASAPTAAPPAAVAPAVIERSIAEPPDVTAKRRARASAEIDERAPGLAAAKRAILLDEADRLAWDKRQLRAAFLAGKLSETEYVDALKDDIRAALASYDDVLTDDEYVALFNRRRGTDPFTLESLVGRPPEQR